MSSRSKKYYLGATDWRWYNYLSSRAPEDVNFWQPGGQTAFRAQEPGGPFLFKLKKPHHAIGGIGFLLRKVNYRCLWLRTHFKRVTALILYKSFVILFSVTELIKSVIRLHAQ